MPDLTITVAGDDARTAIRAAKRAEAAQAAAETARATTEAAAGTVIAHVDALDTVAGAIAAVINASDYRTQINNITTYLSQVVALGNDLNLGASSAVEIAAANVTGIQAVATDLALGSGASFILRAPAAATAAAASAAAAAATLVQVQNEGANQIANIAAAGGTLPPASRIAAYTSTIYATLVAASTDGQDFGIIRPDGKAVWCYTRTGGKGIYKYTRPYPSPDTFIRYREARQLTASTSPPRIMDFDCVDAMFGPHQGFGQPAANGSVDPTNLYQRGNGGNDIGLLSSTIGATPTQELTSNLPTAMLVSWATASAQSGSQIVFGGQNSLMFIPGQWTFGFEGAINDASGSHDFAFAANRFGTKANATMTGSEASFSQTVELTQITNYEMAVYGMQATAIAAAYSMRLRNFRVVPGATLTAATGSTGAVAARSTGSRGIQLLSNGMFDPANCANLVASFPTPVDMGRGFSFMMSLQWLNDTVAASSPLQGDAYNGHAANSYLAEYLNIGPSVPTTTVKPTMSMLWLGHSDWPVETMAHPADILGPTTLGFRVGKDGNQFWLDGSPLGFRDPVFTPLLGQYLYRTVILGMIESGRGAWNQPVGGAIAWNSFVSAETMYNAHNELMGRMRDANKLFPVDRKVTHNGDYALLDEGDSWSASSTDANGLTWIQYIRNQFTPRLMGGLFAWPNATMSNPYERRRNSAYGRLKWMLEAIRYHKRQDRRVGVVLKMDTNDMPNIINGQNAGTISQATYYGYGRDYLRQCKDAGADDLFFCTYTATSAAGTTTGWPTMSQMVRDNAANDGYTVIDLANGPLGNYTANSGSHFANINHPNGLGVKEGMEDIALPVISAAVAAGRA